MSTDIVELALLVDLRRAADDGDRREAREGRVLVRQRVGLLQPRGRPCAARPRGGAGCLRRAPRRNSASAPSETSRWRRASACSRGWTSTCRSRTAGWPTTRACARRCRRSSCCSGTRARLILCSHLGRPKGRDPKTSLRPVVGAPRRADRRDRAPGARGDRPGGAARRGAAAPGQVLVLENTRWERGETENDPVCRASWPRSRTPTSTTRSAPRTAPTPRPSGSPTTCAPRSPGCCSSAR